MSITLRWAIFCHFVPNLQWLSTLEIQQKRPRPASWPVRRKELFHFCRGGSAAPEPAKGICTVACKLK